MSAGTNLRNLFVIFLAALFILLPAAHAGDGNGNGPNGNGPNGNGPPGHVNHRPLPAPIEACADSGAPLSVILTSSDYTAKVVYCVQYTVQKAVITLMTELSNFMKSTVTMMFIFAIIVFGMHTIAGGDMKAKAPAFLLRLAIVGFFSYNLGGFSNSIFNIEQEMVALVTKSTASLPAGCPFYKNGVLDSSCIWTPWKQIDTFLGMIIGFAPCIVISQGLLGIITAALFSSTVGVAVFVSGIMMLVEIVLFIFDAVYVYLQAIVVIGFMLVISPLIVPLGIFFHTEKYVTRWLNMLLSAMLVPVLLFAFLSLFLGIFTVLLVNALTIMGVTCPALPADLSNNIQLNSYNLCGCTIDFHTFWKNDVPVDSPVMLGDPDFNQAMSDIVKSANDRGITMPSVPAAYNAYMRLGGRINPLALPMLNFGNFNNLLQDWDIKAQLVFSFIALWIFAAIMKSITLRIPQVAESIAASISGLSFQPSPLTRLIKGGGDYEKHSLGKHEDTLAALRNEK